MYSRGTSFPGVAVVKCSVSTRSVIGARFLQWLEIKAQPLSFGPPLKLGCGIFSRLVSCLTQSSGLKSPSFQREIGTTPAAPFYVPPHGHRSCFPVPLTNTSVLASSYSSQSHCALCPGEDIVMEGADTVISCQNCCLRSKVMYVFFLILLGIVKSGVWAVIFQVFIAT